jgi:hypothetical protein
MSHREFVSTLTKATLPQACVLLWLLAIPGLMTAQDVGANANDQLSGKFVQSATVALVSIRDVKQNIATVLSKNLPSGYYDPKLGTDAYEKVRLADVSATTNGDQQAAKLLDTYFAKVKTWAESYKTDRANMNANRTMGEDFLSDDSVYQAIQACEKAYNTMLVNRSYLEIAECR